MDAIHKLHSAELIYWNVLYVNVILRRMGWPRNGCLSDDLLISICFKTEIGT